MNITTEISIGDLISTLALLIAGVGLFLNLRQLRKDSVRNRAEFILQYFSQYLADPDSVELFYKIDYNQFKYEPKRFHGSITERKLDKLLTYFNRISILYELGTVTLDDLRLVRYEFRTFNANKSIQEYLKGIENSHLKDSPYSAFINNVSKLLEKSH